MIRSRRVLAGMTVAISVAMFLSSRPAAADDAQESPGRRRHDGFFVRILVGTSFQAAQSSEDGEDLSVEGPGFTLQAAIGYNIARNLILYAEVFDDVAISTKVTVGDDEGEELEDTSFGIFGAGLGLAYYLPGNFYLSGSAALSQLHATYEEDGTTVKWDSSFGFGANLLVGKEWWVSDGLAIGAALHLLLGSVPDDEADDPWTVGALGLAFSFTAD